MYFCNNKFNSRFWGSSRVLSLKTPPGTPHLVWAFNIFEDTSNVGHVRDLDRTNGTTERGGIGKDGDMGPRSQRITPGSHDKSRNNTVGIYGFLLIPKNPIREHSINTMGNYTVRGTPPNCPLNHSWIVDAPYYRFDGEGWTPVQIWWSGEDLPADFPQFYVT